MLWKDQIREWKDEAREDGLEEGRKEGSNNKAIETAKNLLKKNISAEIIAECTGLPLEEVNSLKE